MAKEILINQLFSGRYLNEGKNIGHEVINFFSDDEGNHNLYITPSGFVKGHELECILFVRNISARKTVEVVGLAKGIKSITEEEANSVRYAGFSLIQLFSNNTYHGIKEPFANHITYRADSFLRPSRRIFITVENYCNSEEYVMRLDSERKVITPQGLREYYSEYKDSKAFEELKALIDEAHENGIAVIMDIVHSHAVKNEVEGLGNLCGDPNQFFYAGERHEHPAWDSLCFDYGKDEVIHFLLSNCKYWLEEFHFDGFRFDGVTSMLYYSHGLGEAFGGYGDYFNGGEDDNAICYLTLANLLIHEVNKNAITIAEEVSGMPGLAAKFEDGGYGFDYRMAMNIPDYWIKIIKEQSDENWKPSSIFWEVKNRRPDEKTISYCESHDQALVGDKTIIFRLIDADMYWHFAKKDINGVAERGIALHKMIRLVTAAAINGGYLNFMGNEFGHPEWIDFPREGNGWSYKYARRQWNLVDNKDLCYHWLGDFDREMLKVIKSQKNFQKTPVQEIWHNDGDQVLAFMRGDLIFVFNFSPTQSFTDYGFLVPTGSYDVVLNTDSKDFGGNGFADDTMTHLTNFDPLYVKEHKEWLKLYIPARSAVVLKKN